jgi:ACR3 family arsenite transporter
MARIGPWSITALLATLVLLFAFQGEAILKQPLVIALLAVPILIQVFFNSGWPTGSTARWVKSTTWPARRR